MEILGLKPMSTWDRMSNIMKIIEENSALGSKTAENIPLKEIDNKGFTSEMTGKVFNEVC